MAKRHRTLAAGGVAGLFLLAVSLLAVFGPATPAQAQIDISGDWNFDVLGFGPDAIPCPSTIEQTDATFTIDAECTNIGFGNFEGEIDVETGEFTASGDIAGIPIELAGTASPDGATIEGTWNAGVFGFSGTISAVRKPPGLTPTPLPTLPAPADVTGTWRISFSGIFSGSCDAVIEQNGGELDVVASCSILGTLALEGTIDPATGVFRVSGGVSLEGQVLSDGASLTGTWSFFGFTGSLTGERVDDIELIDISGDWEMVLLGDILERCTLVVEQGLVATSAVLDCEELGEATLEGAIDPFNGLLWLAGPVGDTEIAFNAQLDSDDSYIFGSVFVASPDVISGHAGPPGTSRTFIAVPAGALERGIVLIGCEQQSVFASSCSSRFDIETSADQIIAELAVPVSPAGGYTGIEATLSWSEPLAFGEAAPSHQCATASSVSAETSVSLACSFAEQTEFAGDLVSVTLTCGETSSATDLTIDSASFTGADPELAPPTMINATVRCFSSQVRIPGDVDCSRDVNSVDAALILQFVAGLLEGLECQFAADINLDRAIDSRDALIVLQFDAGLFDLFP